MAEPVQPPNTNFATLVGEHLAARWSWQYEFVKGLSQRETLLDGSQGRMNRSLNEHIQAHDEFDFMVVVDTDGEYVASNDENRQEKKLAVDNLWTYDFAGESWFKATRQGQRSELRDLGLSGLYVETSVEDQLSKKMGGESRFGYRFVTEIESKKNKKKRIFMTQLNYAWIQEELVRWQRVLTERMDEKIGNVLVVNEQGAILFDASSQGLKSGPANYGKDTGNFLPGSAASVLSGVGAKGTQKELNGDLMVSVAALPPFSRHGKWYVWVEYQMQNLGSAPAGSSAPEVTARVEPAAEVEWFQMGWLKSALFSLISLLGFYLILNRGLDRSTKAIGYVDYAMAGFRRLGEFLINLGGRVKEVSGRQVRSLNESLSSIMEMSRMLQSTTENAERCVKLTRDVSEQTSSGETIMLQMVEAMGSIEQAYAELQTINEIITAIAEKASVIHDIVFKTELLSFNASIEAAQAGIHGRGFAIVAEEIGKLSLISGTAASEIQDLLNGSRQKVVDIITTTHLSLAQGREVAGAAQEKFAVIARNIGEIQGEIHFIADSTKEKVNTIHGVNLAMEELKNLADAQAEVGEELQTIGDELTAKFQQVQRAAQTARIMLGGHSGRELAKVSGSQIDRLGQGEFQGLRSVSSRLANHRGENERKVS